MLSANITGLQFLGKSSGAYSFVVSHKFIGKLALHSSHPNPESLQIEQWFATLENDDLMCNQRGIEFGMFGRVLAQNGFMHITQLSHNIITIKDLQDWLEIDAGTAAFIMEYAQEDVHQFKEAGGLLY